MDKESDSHSNCIFLKSLLMCTSYDSVYASLMLLELVFSQVHPCSYLRVEL